MASKRLWCTVYGCYNEHNSRYDLPRSDPLKTQWLNFVFKGTMPPDQPKCIHVCANHFSADCFINQGQYKAGFAKKLLLKKGSVPTIRVPASAPKASTCEELVQHVCCQKKTAAPCTAGAQRPTSTTLYRSTGTQTTMLYPETGAGCSKPSTPTNRPKKRPRLELEEEAQEPSGTEEEPRDSTSDPAWTEPIDVTFESSKPAHETATYIVYESCLLQLFERCPVCRCVTDVRRAVFGTFLAVEQHCPHCAFFRKWSSQPIIQSTPAGNLQLSVALYAAGASFFRVRQMFRAMRLKTIRYSTFLVHARRYIEPAIAHSWRTARDATLRQLRLQRGTVLGCHSGKFGSYSVMDLRTRRIIDLQLLQSNEVGGSNHTEEESLRRSLDVLRAHGVSLDSVVTDRHPHVQKLLREASITQYYDVRHVEKGVSKKLLRIARSKGSEKLQKWCRSIKNHMYWTAASSSSGPERVAKWTSILNHVRDVHTHDDPVFPRCLHPRRATRDRSRWLRAGTPAFCRLEKLLRNKRTLKDVEKLSPHQTSSLEALQSVILSFVPKSDALSFRGMLCRLYLAALHFNENAGRPRASAAAQETLLKAVFPKYKKGQCSAKPVKAEPTFHYVDSLLDLIFENVVVDPAPYMEDILKLSQPSLRNQTD